MPFPDDQPVAYGCPACARDRPFSAPGHTDQPDGPLKCRRYSRIPRRMSSRVSDSRIQSRPVPHERDDERLVRPADLPDGEGDTEEEPEADREASSSAEDAQQPRPMTKPSGSRRQRGKQRPYQVRQRDIDQPIAPPEDADERDEAWSAMNWKKSLKELCDPNLEVVKRRLRRIHLRWYHASAPSMIRLLEMIGCPDATIKLVHDVVAPAL